MRKPNLIGSAVAAALIGTPVLAADMPVKVPVYKTPVVAAQAVNWTGVYIGIHGGADGFYNHWLAPPIFDAGAHSGTSWLAGGQAGFNYQIASWVIGVEGQFSWTQLEGSNGITIVNDTDNSRTYPSAPSRHDLGSPGIARCCLLRAAAPGRMISFGRPLPIACQPASVRPRQ